MSSYYQYLFEADEKDMNASNFTDYTFENLSTRKQIEYIDYFLQKFRLQGRLRPSDNMYNKFYIEFEDENVLQTAVSKFSSLTGLQNHGDTFVTNDATFIFLYNYNVRNPVNDDGTNQWDNKEDKLLKFANNIRKGYQLGKRLYHMGKPNLKSLNPEF